MCLDVRHFCVFGLAGVKKRLPSVLNRPDPGNERMGLENPKQLAGNG